jgi:glucose/arabinose dehydrogenase
MLRLLLLRWPALALGALLLGCSSPAGTARPGGTAAPGGAVSRAGASSANAAQPAAPLVANNAASADPTLVPAAVAGAGALGRPVLSLPPGFAVSIVASGLVEPRFMAFDPAGNLVVGSNGGSVYRLAAAGAGAFGSPVPILTGLRAPHSVAFLGSDLYVAETNRVTRYSYASDGTLGPAETVIGDLPLVGEHFTRTIVFGPDGKLYLSAGSSCNICQEQDPRRAAISRYNADGSGWQRFAWGARNAVGLAVQPGTGRLWAAVNERDYQGNEIPPDYVTAVDQGDDFGWPNCLPPNAAPQDPGNDCSAVTPPTVAIQAHAAPLGLVFYTGGQFPADYQNDIIVVEHGSWNRQPPAPPQLVRIHFENGAPVSVRDFATGWQTDDAGTRWGRPAGIAVAPDGSLIVSDDTAGLIYRISYGG